MHNNFVVVNGCKSLVNAHPLNFDVLLTFRKDAAPLHTSMSCFLKRDNLADISVSPDCVRILKFIRGSL